MPILASGWLTMVGDRQLSHFLRHQRDVSHVSRHWGRHKAITIAGCLLWRSIMTEWSIFDWWIMPYTYVILLNCLCNALGFVPARTGTWCCEADFMSLRCNSDQRLPVYFEFDVNKVTLVFTNPFIYNFESLSPLDILDMSYISFPLFVSSGMGIIPPILIATNKN